MDLLIGLKDGKASPKVEIIIKVLKKRKARNGWVVLKEAHLSRPKCKSCGWVGEKEELKVIKLPYNRKLKQYAGIKILCPKCGGEEFAFLKRRYFSSK